MPVTRLEFLKVFRPFHQLPVFSDLVWGKLGGFFAKLRGKLCVYAKEVGGIGGKGK